MKDFLVKLNIIYKELLLRPFVQVQNPIRVCSFYVNTFKRKPFQFRSKSMRLKFSAY